MHIHQIISQYINNYDYIMELEAYAATMLVNIM